MTSGARRFLAPVLLGATLLLLGANAVPALLKERRLESEVSRLKGDLARERTRGDGLRARLNALRNDPYYVERLYRRTWNAPPEHAIAWSQLVDKVN